MINYPIQGNPSQLTNISSPKQITLREGQFIYASVQKHLGEGLAEVSVGGQKLIAKLQAPLAVGESYWFKVNAGDSGLELKVLQGKEHTAPTFTSIANGLLEQLQLTKNKDIQSVLVQLLKLKLPIHKDVLIQGSQWLASTEEKELGIQALLKMVKENIPIQKSIYQSIVAGKSSESISTLLNELTGLLKSEKNVNIAPNKIQQTIDAIRNPLQKTIVNELVVKALETFLNEKNPFSVRYAGLELLKSFELLPKNATMNNWKTELAQSVNNVKQLSDAGNWQALIQEAVSASKDIEGLNQRTQRLYQEVQAMFPKIEARSPLTKSEVEKVLNAISTLIGQNSSKTSNLLGLLLNALKKPTDTNLTHHFTRLNNLANVPIEKNEIRLFQQLLYQSENEVIQQNQSKQMNDIVTSTLRLLGMNNEAQLQKGNLPNLEQLKPQLIQLLQENAGGAIRETAEKLLFKLNGQVLLSQENGPLLQITHQIPMSIFNQQQDVVIQWSGKEKKQGEIDSDYCRVLFYLELENLKETMIDMQVQNRVVSIIIWNDSQQVDQLAESFTPLLKEGLSKLNYQLSSVRAKQPESKLNVAQFIARSTEEQQEYTGVDFRI